MPKSEIIIAAFARTPIGNLAGELKNFSAAELGSCVISGLVERANLPPDQVQEVIMGCVLPAGVGQAPARQAALSANLATHTACTTINKVCGSGMKAVMLAADILRAESQDIIIAGGMESMTNAPYLLKRARQGYRLGHGELLDHLVCDGLENAYDKKPMGYFAENCAIENNFSREEQDQFAITSLQRAQKSIINNLFNNEIIPIKQAEIIINIDEHPNSVKIEKIPKLSPVFVKNGTITAANASSIADGAAGVLLMRDDTAKQKNIKPIAKITAHTTYAAAPENFTTAPVGAIKLLLQKTGWKISDVDLFEINEAFAVVAMYAMRELNIPHEKLNIHGGACALGHPIGASGARIIVTLISALQQYNLKRGIAALCIGGGEATAIGIEIL